MEKRSCYFCLEQKNKPEKRTARHWAKGSVSGSPVCMYMYIYDYVYAYMLIMYMHICVYACVYIQRVGQNIYVLVQ